MLCISISEDKDKEKEDEDDEEEEIVGSTPNTLPKTYMLGEHDRVFFHSVFSDKNRNEILFEVEVSSF